MVFYTSATNVRRWLLILTAGLISLFIAGIGAGIYFIVHRPDTPAPETPPVTISLTVPAPATTSPSVSTPSELTSTATVTEILTMTLDPSSIQPPASMEAPILPTTLSSVTITITPIPTPSSGKSGDGEATEAAAGPHASMETSTLWMTMTALSAVTQKDGSTEAVLPFTITAHKDTVVPATATAG